MLAWLWRLIVGDWCHHEWEDAGPIIATRQFDSDQHPYERRQLMQCKKCGIRRSFKL